MILAAGFTTSHTSCCDVDTSVGGLCLPTASVCEDRKEFVFWDAYHTSDAANQVIAAHLYADMVSAGDAQEPQGNATAAPKVVRSPPRPLPRAPASRPAVRGSNTTSAPRAAPAARPHDVVGSPLAAPPPRA
jgi:hypothetical protein